ncbi:MAG: NAD(P)H-hydrate epimerase [Bilophila wadsworthia]
MFAPLPSPAEMSGWDRAAIDLGLPELLLMENASREALHVLSAETGHMPGKRVLLFMGGGNNGGDAACLARHLHDGGAEVLVLHTRPLGAYRGVTDACAAGPALRRGVAPAAGWPENRNTPWDVYADASVCERGGPDIVVDGILGTAFPATSGRWSLGVGGSTRWRNGPSFLWISRPAFPD